MKRWTVSFGTAWLADAKQVHVEYNENRMHVAFYPVKTDITEPILPLVINGIKMSKYAFIL